jgi:hypothetical protein
MLFSDVPLSTVIQNDTEGHDRDASAVAPEAVSRGDDHDDPFHVMDRPLPSTAMQSEVERQFTAGTPPSQPHAGEDHVVPFQVEKPP